MDAVEFRMRCEQKRQRIQKIERFLKISMQVVTLILWAACMAGFVDYFAGGW